MAEQQSKEPEKTKREPEVTSRQVIGALSQLAGQLKQMQTQNEQLTTKLSELEKSAKAPKREAPDDDRDIETMSNKQLADYILSRVNEALSDKVGELSSEVKNVSTETQRDRLEREVREFAEKHNDFWEWQDEIRQLAQENPKLSVKRLYNLARTENPEKAQEVDERLSAKEAEKDAEKAKEGGETTEATTETKENPKSPGKQSFGGLPPGGGTETKTSDRMTLDNAAETAWNEVVSGDPKLKELLGE